MVRSSSGAAYADIWSTIDTLLETSRPHHYRRYPVSTANACTTAVSSTSTTTSDDSSSGSMLHTTGSCLPVTCCCGGGARSNCLICCRCDPHSTSPVPVVRRLFAKSRAGGLGYVEVPPPMVTSVSASTTAANGHATPSMNVDDVTFGSTCRSMIQLSSSSSSSCTTCARFPHVVGYFEIDSRIRKDCKSGVHHSVEYLKAALPRLATGYGIHGCTSSQASTTGSTTGNCRSLVGTAGSGCGGVYRIPRGWVALLRVLSDASRHRSSSPAWLPPSTAAPFIVVDDLRMLARKCDIPTSQVGEAGTR